MDRTPVKSPKKDGVLSPVSVVQKLDIKSPSSPISSCHLRTAKDNVVQLNKLFHDWKQLNTKSLVLIKSIFQIKSKSLDTETSCVDELESIFLNGEEVIAGYENIVCSMNMINKKFEALTKLCDPQELLFVTSTALQVENLVSKIVQGYEKELATKKLVYENIAHAKSLSKLTMYAAAWEYEVYLESVSVDVLRLNMETNLPVNT
ncbi:uncharacterized protein LOC113382817 [Ctenocephalides felis]|uniref:uncharacterized protein LOC113382817 n=1 Tax=Ctenocephalides felis TaxID=7515 RepID=UPI000E6E59F2|nr:uncharacterized protein LOC113382817 [Ctenocephalides felis]